MALCLFRKLNAGVYDDSSYDGMANMVTFYVLIYQWRQTMA